MTWNYRLIERQKNGYTAYELVEVYYKKHGKIWAYTDPITLDNYEDPEDLLADLDKFRRACEDKILTERDLPKENADDLSLPSRAKRLLSSVGVRLRDRARRPGV